MPIPSLLLALLVSAAAGSTDWALGIFYLDPKADQGGYLYPATVQVFVNSFLATHATARLAIVTNEETAQHVYPACQWQFDTRCTLIHVDDALDEIKAGRFLRRASVYVRRHYLNLGALTVLRAHAKRSGMDNGSMVVLTDVRDVAWEEDFFTRIRAKRARDGLATGEEPLYFALEPFNAPLRAQGWNYEMLRLCYGNALAERIGDMPVTCSGTTAGSLHAIRTYVQAMSTLTQFCGGPGRKAPNSIGGGVDQPAHIYLLYDTIMSRREEEGWLDRYGRMFWTTVPHTDIRYPFHPQLAVEPAYRDMHGLLQQHFNGSRRVVPIPIFNEDAEICTFARYGPPPGTWPTAAMDGKQRFPTSPPDGPPCALVHMYDRTDGMIVRYVTMWTNFTAVAPGYDNWPDFWTGDVRQRGHPKGGSGGGVGG